MTLERLNLAALAALLIGLGVAALVVVSVYESLGAVVAGLGPAPRDRAILTAEAALSHGRWPPLWPAPLPPSLCDRRGRRAADGGPGVEARAART